VWRRAKGSRRRLLHGLIQVAVGYEHNKRGNPRGMRSLLRQGATKLRYFTRRPGVGELREKALSDADGERAVPPKIMVTISGFAEEAPRNAIRITVPTR
jgi:hypothetical protein